MNFPLGLHHHPEMAKNGFFLFLLGGLFGW
jgi:hypothetical protein